MLTITREPYVQASSTTDVESRGGSPLEPVGALLPIVELSEGAQPFAVFALRDGSVAKGGLDRFHVGAEHRTVAGIIITEVVLDRIGTVANPSRSTLGQHSSTFVGWRGMSV